MRNVRDTRLREIGQQSGFGSRMMQRHGRQFCSLPPAQDMSGLSTVQSCQLGAVQQAAIGRAALASERGGQRGGRPAESPIRARFKCGFGTPGVVVEGCIADRMGGVRR